MRRDSQPHAEFTKLSQHGVRRDDYSFSLHYGTETIAPERATMSSESQPGIESAEHLSLFIESHRKQLLSFVDRNLGPAVRSRIEPEDIVQETMVSALAALDQFQVAGRDPFRLLCQIAEQRIIDSHRHHVAAQKRSTTKEVSADAPISGTDGFGFADLLVASMTSPSQAFSRNQKEIALQQALAELNDEQREVLRLRFVENLPTKEIADRIGKTDGAVRVMLTRTVAHLQELLSMSG